MLLLCVDDIKIKFIQKDSVENESSGRLKNQLNA